MSGAGSPPSPAMARALVDHVARCLGAPDGRACNHTLRHAREWCEADRLPWPAMRTWLNAAGAYCDCEVLFNIPARLDRDEAA